MSIGIIMLCHTALDRAAQVARFWAEGGCPVVIHIDRRAPVAEAEGLRYTLADLPEITFLHKFACEWGTWRLVGATLAASDEMLTRNLDVEHVFLASGSCLPLRPVSDLRAYLAARPHTDFIESVATEDVDWAIGGINHERFTLRFPFSWKRRRRLFDRYVALQRRLKVKRRIPEGLVPHLGSQWWCLTRQTLGAILLDPERPVYDRYFNRVWIPDESYFQTLVRVHSARIESRSLTLSKFDFQGKPHVFYDDHIQLLRRSDCFVARKIWPQANRLYEAFLAPAADQPARANPNPGKIDRLFSRAVDRRTRGRPGLYMQSRFPQANRENGKTAGPYSVFHGFTDLYPEFQSWLAKSAGAQVHGHLFAPGRAEFAGGGELAPGCLSDAATLRDYAPKSFLTSLLWNNRGERQCFMYSPRDTAAISRFIASDANARVSVISGAWAVPLFLSNQGFATIRREAARLQRIEAGQLADLRAQSAKARVRIWTLAEFVENPMDGLQQLIDEFHARGAKRLAELPRMVDLTGFGQFLQDLKNQGMPPVLMGDFAVCDAAKPPVRRQRTQIAR